MNFPDDPRVMDAKGIPMTEVVHRIGIAGLIAQGAEMVGPCPLCGGKDRFAINLRSNLFQCRKCDDVKGGDQIALVMQVLNLSFPDALKWLCGDAPAHIDPAELQRRRARAAADAARQAEEQDRYRRRAIDDAKRIWQRSEGADRGLVRAYLKARGITETMMPEVPRALRLLPDHPYVKKVAGQLVTCHRGPCMISAIQAPGGMLEAVHQTWISAAAPHGKAQITQDGADLPAKLVRGSKKGGAIRLHTPRDTDTMVVGEGIETTLTAMAAAPVPSAAYWAGVDLGNMSGRMQRIKGTRHSGLPDMTDDTAFVPPPWVRRLIFIQDGDSDPKATRAKLESGLRRAMARVPRLKGQIVHAGAGVDLNDVLNSNEETDDGDTQD
ncbi:hypothetical protein [uncultured Sulfitobacter sp.]|uniref:DUF7146 domain-containing protein n=1 Tax=uncultured Sulfitobacter sp. TaxID=191468 RepID=UPI00260A93F2|nr:hypothetical protein [uncultured Sulfitobacter sp.]